MAEQLSLSWDAYQKNICNGLSMLQQHGEFVDMTLAADGHHVKVHKMVLSLVSPYIKELISTAQCPHPIIFLNNISYTTLCAVLEYIYSGEVSVSRDRLPDLIAAGKALHIKGLREMDEQETSQSVQPDFKTSTPKETISDRLREFKERKLNPKHKENPARAPPLCKIFVKETNNDNKMDFHEEINISDDYRNESDTDENRTLVMRNKKTETGNSNDKVEPIKSYKDVLLNPNVQYTVSTQGGLQIIYNRYIYHLRYYGKKKHVRLWRCVDYSTVNLKCQANVYTDENSRVTSRSHKHNHPFHDDKILKKLRQNKIYLAFTEAANIAESRRKARRMPCSTVDEGSDSDEPNKSDDK